MNDNDDNAFRRQRIRKTLQDNGEQLRKVLEDAHHTSECKCKRKKVSVTLMNPWNGWIHSTFVNQSLGQECSGERGNCGCMHAEPQAIIWALNHSEANESFILLSTFAPCSSCANLIVHSAKISGVVYAHFTDHDADGLGILTRANIPNLRIPTDIPDMK